MILFAYGFRVFFVAAGLMAVGAGAAWALTLWGVSLPGVDPLWHAHEMVFGFGGALISGFLLTAVPKWTKTAHQHGSPLAVLLLFWLGGRAAPFLPASLDTVGHALGTLHLWGLAWLIGRPIVGTRNKRNVGVVLVLIVFATFGTLGHLRLAGSALWLSLAPSRAGAEALVLLMAIVGGRITPLFTKNALGDAVTVRPRGVIDDLALWSTAIAFAAGWAGAPSVVTGGLLVVAGLLSGARVVGWGGLAAARVPLLAVLHLGYAWIAVGLVLCGAVVLAPHLAPPSAAHHALTAGALGTYGFGMMARVGLGHTGRPLRPHVGVVVGFALVLVVGVLRVVPPGLAVARLDLVFVAAASLWTLAFALWCLVYLPLLARPRADGRPG